MRKTIAFEYSVEAEGALVAVTCTFIAGMQVMTTRETTLLANSSGRWLNDSGTMHDQKGEKSDTSESEDYTLSLYTTLQARKQLPTQCTANSRMQLYWQVRKSKAYLLLRGLG
jgi:hypothetical protein